MSLSKVVCLGGIALLFLCIPLANVADAKQETGRGGGAGAARPTPTLAQTTVRVSSSPGGGGGSSQKTGGAGGKGTVSQGEQEFMNNVTGLMNSINNPKLTAAMQVAMVTRNVTTGIRLLKQISTGQVGGTQRDWTRAGDLLEELEYYQLTMQQAGPSTTPARGNLNGGKKTNG